MRSVKIIKTLLIIAALPLLAGAATRRYTVELSTEPAARFASRSFGAHKESLARPEVQTHLARIHKEQDKLAAEIRQLGGRVVSRTDTALNTLTVELPEEKEAQLGSLTGVKNYHAERHYKALLDKASLVHRLPDVYSQIGGSSAAGRGIKIGMIDTGIDISQSAFSDSGFQAPDGFPKVNAVTDTKYTNNKVIVARSYVALLDSIDSDNSAADHQGHGTITSDCAAGGLTTVTGVPSFTGIAPGAYLGSYKVFGSSGENDNANDAAILKAIDDAVKDGMDIINYSIGSPIPIPPDQDPPATALNNAFAMGIIVTVSVGNEGNGWNPLLAAVTPDGTPVTIPTFANTEGSGNVISVGGSSNQRAFGMSLTVGSNQYLIDSEDAVSTDAAGNALVITGAPIVDVATIDQSGRACSALPANSLKGTIALISLAGWDLNTDDCNPSTKLFNAGNAGAVAGIIYDFFEEDLFNLSDLAFYIGYDYFGGANSVNLPGGFITLSDGLGLKKLLATQTNTTATLDFNSPFGSVVSYGNTVQLSQDRLWYGSSRGPNVAYEIKPEMVAVGEYLLAASQTLDTGANFYDPSGVFFPVDGTSASAPIVAGAASILKAARPGLTTAQYRSLLINSSSPMHDINGNLARVMDAGAGLLDVKASLNAEAAVVPATLSFGVADGSATIIKNLTISNTGTAPDTFHLNVVGRDTGFVPQVSPASLQLAPGASGTVQVTIPGGVLTAGEYEGDIHIQANNTATDTHVPYWFGIPSGSPYMLLDMGSDSADARGKLAKGAIVFRVTDASRIIMTDIVPQVTVTYQGIDTGSGTITSGNGKVNLVYSADGYSPGTIAVDVTLDSHRGVYNVYTVKIGSLSLDFYIQGQ